MRSVDTPHAPERQPLPEEKWKGRVVYQIYPNTFNEARPPGKEHTGRGSILGVIENLDHLEELGIGAIWLSPFYKSPMVDGGYDIADYTEVDPGLGTREDVEQLIREAHERDIKILFDLVPNHTSDQHEWFQQSAADPEGEYGDHYIWRDAVKILSGQPDLPHNIVGADRLEGLPHGYTVPNNWSTIFSEPERVQLQEQYGGTIPDDVEVSARTAWVWHAGRQQFYLAEFAKEQPTLNWANPEVRESMGDVMRFWLDRGVDGFRVDVVNHVGKDPEFRDEVPVPAGQYDKNKNNPHDQWTQERMVSHWGTLKGYLEEMIGVLDAYPGTRLVLEDWMTALSGGEDRLSKLRPDKAVVFNFARLLQTNAEGWDAQIHKKLLDTYYSMHEFVEWGNQVDSNHDVDRVRERLGKYAARTAALIKLTSPGNPYVYQGEEGGFPNANVPKNRRRDDGLGLRDGERTPILWDASKKNAGFSEAPEEKLWLPIDSQRLDLNLADQKRDPRSPYSLYRAAIAERRASSSLARGGYTPLETDHANVLAFGRSLPHSREQYVTVANFSGEYVDAAILNPQQGLARIALENLHGPSAEVIGRQVQLDVDAIPLAPHQAVLLRTP